MSCSTPSHCVRWHGDATLENDKSKCFLASQTPHHVWVWAAHASSGLLLIHAGCEAHLPAMVRWSGWKRGRWKLLSLRSVPLLHVTNSSAQWEGCDNEEISNTHTLKAPRGSLISEPDAQTECVWTRGGEFFTVISISALREERKVNNGNQESSNRWIPAEESRLVIPFTLPFVEH